MQDLWVVYRQHGDIEDPKILEHPAEHRADPSDPRHVRTSYHCGKDFQVDPAAAGQSFTILELSGDGEQLVASGNPSFLQRKPYLHGCVIKFGEWQHVARFLASVKLLAAAPGNLMQRATLMLRSPGQSVKAS